MNLKTLHDSFISAISQIGQLDKSRENQELQVTIEKMWFDLLVESISTYDIINTDSQLSQSITHLIESYLKSLSSEQKSGFGQQLLDNMQSKIDKILSVINTKVNLLN